MRCRRIQDVSGAPNEINCRAPVRQSDLEALCRKVRSSSATDLGLTVVEATYSQGAGSRTSASANTRIVNKVKVTEEQKGNDKSSCPGANT